MRLLPAAPLLFFLLSACGGSAAAGPTPTVSSLPSPNGALPSGPTITTADEGQTVHIKVGQDLTLDLKADQGMQNWQVQDPDPAVLQPIVNPAALAVRGVTLRSFKGIAAGTAAIMATERPECSPGAACPQLIRAFKATVVVDPA